MKWMIGLILIVISTGCDHSKKIGAAPTPVRVELAEQFITGKEIRYSANIQPREEIHLAFKTSGYVDELLQIREPDGGMRNVQSGDSVRRGAILARLRKADFEARLQQARAHLAQSQAAAQNSRLELERATKLFETQSLTRSDFDTATARAEETQSRVDAAKAHVAEAEIALRDSDLKAPIDGVVIQRSVEAGDLASPGSTIFVLANTTSVKGTFGVPDVLISRFKTGQRYPLLLEAVPGVEFDGVVTRISPSADQRNRLFETEVSIRNPDNALKPGMIASIVIRPENAVAAPVLVVPLTSVIAAKNKSDRYAVMVVAEQKGKKVAHLREITLGETFGDRIAVTGGLQRGEQVITVGATLVESGDEIKIIP